jgi:hypothetical protein
MTILEVYRGILKELDKTESPSFSADDFDYWFNSTLDLYLSGSLPMGEVLQKGADRMDYFVAYGKPLNQDATDKSLFKITGLTPPYRHVWSVVTTFKWLVTFGKHAKDSASVLYPKRRRSNRKGYQESNAYQSPSYRYPLYELYNDDTDRYLRVLAGSMLEAQAVKLDYVKEFATFSLASSGDEFPVPDYMAREIIRLTARQFLENIESPRYMTQLQESRQHNE